jgi:hypothetical protein
MGNSKFTAHYWQHKCPAESVEDGDDVYYGHPNITYDKISFLKRIQGKECSVEDCKYKVNEKTVILNKDKEQIRTLGGKNLYPERTRAYKMRCCQWRCRNKNTMGHSLDNPNFNELGNHCCTHAFVYQHAIHDDKITKRLPGCKCVMLNTYNEEIATWEPDGQPKVPIPGGPLDLDNKYHEKQKTRDLLSAAKALEHELNDGN